MTTLLIVLGALFLAVICRAVLDPQAPEAAQVSEHRADDPTPIMDSIALSLF